MALAGQACGIDITTSSPETRKLAAQLLLSETLEYVIKGLGVIPEFNGTEIHAPDELNYHISDKSPNPLEMLDGLSDVAYTMYWNSNTFGLRLEEAFGLVCDNNLEKFVRLLNWQSGEGPLARETWDCGVNIIWPNEVVAVQVLKIDSEYYAVGKDARGKVRKPSSYKSVNLSHLLKS